MSISGVCFFITDNVGFLRLSPELVMLKKLLFSSDHLSAYRSSNKDHFRSPNHLMCAPISRTLCWKKNIFWRVSQIIWLSQFIERKAINIRRTKVMTVWVVIKVFFYWTPCKSPSRSKNRSHKLSNSLKWWWKFQDIVVYLYIDL